MAKTKAKAKVTATPKDIAEADVCYIIVDGKRIRRDSLHKPVKDKTMIDPGDGNPVPRATWEG